MTAFDIKIISGIALLAANNSHIRAERGYHLRGVRQTPLRIRAPFAGGLG